ncbi:MAG: DUF4214 domain-containing protein [Pyrinomonadaceae bacterium]|nr:DUF4214 domain-containing protein [Pyrinomonadaceae bacterium]
MISRNIIRSLFSIKVNQLFHFVFVLTLFAAASGMLAAHEARAATFTVTNTFDCLMIIVPCEGGLRRAIADANSNPGADTIVFNIPGAGVQSIVLESGVLEITDPVFIDGWSQGGAGYTGPPLIEVTAPPSQSATGPGLIINTNSSTVRGLVLNGFKTAVQTPPLPTIYADGIRINGNNNTILGCYIGTTANGQAASSNQGDGIYINGNDNVIGGITAGARNVISGNGTSSSDRAGIRINGNDNRVEGNYIGVRADGFTGQGNFKYGIVIIGDHNRIGGLPFGDVMRGNVISGNGLGGIKIGDVGLFGAVVPGNSNDIQGNHIGVGANGSTGVGNNGIGVLIQKGSFNLIGGVLLGELPLGGNTIRNNLSQGVAIGGDTENQRNRVSLNSIHSNGNPTSLLGIDLFSGTGFGITPNDDCDTDEGVNSLQNFPVIDSAISFDGNTTITGLLDSHADKTYTVEFFHSTTRDPSGFGEGRTYLGTRSIAISRPGCTASFNATFSEPVTPGHFITATATDPSGNTSEFSQSLVVVASLLQFNAASYNAAENGGNATITVTRMGSTLNAASVTYATVPGGTAQGGTDYASTSGILLFETGETSKTFTVPIFDDNVFEGNETVNLTISGLTGAGVALSSPSTAVLTIVENEAQPTISINDVSLMEGNAGAKTFTFTVMLSGASTQTVSVTYATADGTATAPIDYSATGNTLTYTAGQTSKTVNVFVNGDPGGEPDETFFVNLTNPTNAPIADGQGLGTILNDDNCLNSINPTNVNATAVGGTGSVSVTSGCAWTAVSNAVWITVTSGSTGSGNGTVGYSVAANTGAARIGTITIAGQIFTVNQAGTTPTPTPSPTPAIVTTPPGTDVNVQGNGVSVTFSEVTIGGTTTIAPIDPNSVGSVPSGYAIFGSSVAFEITTTAGITPPIDLCFNLPAVNDPVAFGNLRVLHNENGLLVDRTLSHEFATRTICARTTTLSPFLVAQATQNPIDTTHLFVLQHYRDFLNREPDAAGLQFWSNEIDGCGIDLQCREVKRINVSAAFFLSIEFQETGFLVYRFFKSAYGDATSPGVPGTVPIVRYQGFLPDTQALGEGVEVGIGDWQQKLETNKQAYALAFVQRQRFIDAFPLSLTPAQFVDLLNQRAGGVLDTAERAQLIDELTANNTGVGRASVLRRVAEDSNLRQAELNRAFVLMQYYGYLGRNPDDVPDTNFGGWKFWLDKLNQFNGNFIQAEMVKAFIFSGEYRDRFFTQP